MNKSEAVMEQPQSGNDRAELQVGAETVSYNRTLPPAPPPYTPSPYSVPDRADGEPQLIHQTIIVQAPLKNGPITYNCPACRERIVTTVEYINSKKTHLIAGFICGLTLWCSLCCLAAIPYFTSTFKEAVHYCPNCKTFLGSYSKI